MNDTNSQAALDNASGGFLDGLTNLLTAGGQVASNLLGSGNTNTRNTNTATPGTSSLSAYLPIILIGGAVLAVVAFLAFRKS